jgi:hypothetical protein
MKRFTVLIVLFCLVGCVTVNEEMLRKVSVFPPQKPAMTVEVKTGDLIQTLNGEGQNRGVLSGTTVLKSVATSMMLRWKDKGIIADYAFPGDLKKEPDYTIILSGTKNEDSSILAAILSGLTFIIIPTSSTLTYDLNIEFINNHTQKHYIVKAKNAVTIWMQIFLLPAVPFSWIGSHNMVNDIADYSFDELQKQGAFI